LILSDGRAARKSTIPLRHAKNYGGLSKPVLAVRPITAGCFTEKRSPAVLRGCKVTLFIPIDEDQSQSKGPTMQKITTCLWFDGNAEEAVALYTSIFKSSKVKTVTRYGEAGKEIHGKPPGTVLTIAFELEGREFMALNGGPMFKFTEAISLCVNCETQEEIDYYWERLTQGGDPQAQQCGWLKDKYGLSWQIVPTALQQMVADPDPAKTERVMQALFPMKKLDLSALWRAYEGR
jgi:predicted 3-demethylubiquinone-9 3-methyltransferase (glyoxalase superfamily)